MIPIGTLERAVRKGLEAAGGAPGVIEAEVFASENTSWIARLNYTSHIPSNGVEEPKSQTSYGVGVRAVFRSDAGQSLLGFGSEPCDLSTDAVLRALEKARLGAVLDPDFHGLPEPSGEGAVPVDHDEKLDALADDVFVGLAWNILRGALDVFASSGIFNTVILGGDMRLLSERMAVGNTRGIMATDQSSLLSATMTAMIEREQAKGTGWTSAASVDAFHPEEAGAEAARGAVAARGGKRVAPGRHTVIFGPQAVADLLMHLIAPSLILTAFDEAYSPFLGRWGETIAHPDVQIFDRGDLPGAVGSKRVTCEGIPTGRTDLVKDGRLVGLLSDSYSAQKCLADPGARDILGVQPDSSLLTGRNGFRFGPGGGRRFDRKPSIAATHLFIGSARPVSRETLLSMVGNGLYIGRIWYTYPVNGLKAGDFTATVVGDSYLIRGGAIQAPLMPNTVRINDTFTAILSRIIGMTDSPRATLPWAADEVIHAPEIAVSDVSISAISHPSQEGTAGPRGTT